MMPSSADHRARGGTPPVCTRDARAPLKVHRITLANFIRGKNLAPWHRDVMSNPAACAAKVKAALRVGITS